MHSRVLVLILLFCLDRSRRTFHTIDSHHYGQQQKNSIADDVKVSDEAREAFIPGGFGTHGVRRAGPPGGAFPSEYAGHAGHVEPPRSAPSSHFGPRRANVTLQDGGARPAGAEFNGVDDKYPWRFDGRFWFRPALMRAPQEPLPGGLSVISLFGWTIGGVVALEYDESPVGPYREYVTLGAIVTKGGAIGQWGSRLFVSTPEAEEVCKRVWGVPAELRNIEFKEDGEGLRVDSPPGASASDDGVRPEAIRLSGWEATRSSPEKATLGGSLQILWTPTVKTLWAPLLLPFSTKANDVEPLKLHGLRLSASSARLQLGGQPGSPEIGWPLPIGFSVDNVRIEISPEKEKTL